MEEKIAFQVRERGIVLAGGIGIMVFTLFILVAGNRKRIWRYLKESRRKQACKTICGR